MKPTTFFGCLCLAAYFGYEVGKKVGHFQGVLATISATTDWCKEWKRTHQKVVAE